jgi:hypothetical protein
MDQESATDIEAAKVRHFVWLTICNANFIATHHVGVYSKHCLLHVSS